MELHRRPLHADHRLHTLRALTRAAGGPVAGALFLLVFLATFPVVIPFLFMHNAQPALRVSNAIAIVLLFLTGYAFGRLAGRRPWVVGVSMVVLGVALVSMTMALGG